MIGLHPLTRQQRDVALELCVTDDSLQCSPVRFPRGAPAYLLLSNRIEIKAFERLFKTSHYG